MANKAVIFGTTHRPQCTSPARFLFACQELHLVCLCSAIWTDKQTINIVCIELLSTLAAMVKRAFWVLASEKATLHPKEEEERHVPSIPVFFCKLLVSWPFGSIERSNLLLDFTFGSHERQCFMWRRKSLERDPKQFKIYSDCFFISEVKLLLKRLVWYVKATSGEGLSKLT